MSWLEAIVLGIAQGLTEFLPISSTAHLRIIPAFAGWEDPGAYFTAVVQLGTMAAVVIYFWRDLVRIVRTWFLSLRRPELRGELDARMGWYVIVATIPIVIFGVAFRDQIENGARNLYLIGVTLIVLGLILLVADRTARLARGVDDVTMRDAVWVGLAQALALIPGTSRSGATITAGLFLGLKREAAARFSFLLSVPAIVLSGLYGLLEIFTGSDDVSLGPLAVATVFAFVFGYISIAFLLRFLATHSMLVFVVYRVVLGAITIGLVGQRDDQLGDSTTSNSRARSTSSSTRWTAPEGRAMPKGRPASRQAWRASRRARSPDESMKPTPARSRITALSPESGSAAASAGAPTRSSSPSATITTPSARSSGRARKVPGEGSGMRLSLAGASGAPVAHRPRREGVSHGTASGRLTTPRRLPRGPSGVEECRQTARS